MRNRRHTTATHLLRAGDINTIRAWLGHVSINITNIYAETDLEMKANAVATCEVKDTKPSRRWKEEEIPIVVSPVRQKGRIDFLVFENMTVNGTAVEIDEYHRAFNLPNDKDFESTTKSFRSGA